MMTKSDILILELGATIRGLRQQRDELAEQHAAALALVKSLDKRYGEVRQERDELAEVLAGLLRNPKTNRAMALAALSNFRSTSAPATKGVKHE